MKKIITALATIGAISVPLLSNAQASKFEGFYGQVGIGYENLNPSTTMSVTLANVNIPSTLNLSSGNNFVLTGTLGYTFSVQDKFTLGLGIEESPIASKALDASATLSYGGVTATAPLGTYQKNNSYNLFVSPGYAVTDDGLLYGKIGYTGANTTIDGSGQQFNGYTLGLGYKQFISGNIYAFGEINYAKYSDQTASQTQNVSISGTSYPLTVSIGGGASATNLLVGIGYKF